MVELDHEVNDDIMNDEAAAAGMQVPPVPPDSAVLTEITKRLNRYSAALREDHGSSTAGGKRGKVMVIADQD